MPAPTLPTVLVVDDELRSQEALRRTLDEEFEVFTASSAAEALEILAREWIQVVLTDQRMPGTSGVALLREVRERWPDAVRIIVSGYTDSEDIIAGINEAGIFQYLLKPWQPEQLLLTLRNAAQLQRLQAENERLGMDLKVAAPVLRQRVAGKREAVRGRQRGGALLRAPDSPMNTICTLIDKVAGYDIPVLLTGESGTGKELLARALHYGSPRESGAFVVENCGALPDTLLESELFGARRGAYTGATEDREGLFRQASGGSILLDEIGETSAAFQVKLLRVLQEGEVRPVGAPRPVAVDVRVIAATNRDLAKAVAEGRFREDLYYRLNVFPITAPPLRERLEDVPLLVWAFVEEFSKAMGKPVEAITKTSLLGLQRYPWPGNVRELRNTIERVMILASGPTLKIDRPGTVATPVTRGLATLAEAEREHIQRVLEFTGGRIRGASGAAEILGLKPTTLESRMAKLGLHRR